MPDYPVSLNLEGRLCLVVGGGPVGLRKARGLLAAGARVRLVAPQLRSMEQLPAGIDLCRRPFAATDLEGAQLVFAATDDRETNETVAREAQRRGILVNRADTPGGGDFALPALLRRGKLTVAVTTAGHSPSLAAAVRDLLADTLGPEWGTLLEITGALRQKRLTASETTEYNQEVVRSLLTHDLPGLLAAGNEAAIDRLLAAHCGPDCSLAQLGIRLPKGTK
ncbi:siroheme synthase [Desulfuromonas versatilis]|uniref:precorrin-2 dehydrogenase n=1 Tax=Desulfuromonas versatilis TaxID=2802975 RepID=A0ABM9SDG9_9BACT|nr:bifunctional precorrin-2 dehydrogenase/sirohydrochlorin ferrochelatase [Desulfuromonas versatilis]BCR03500.1 siroheme synthase [Desulfuromonas versatilis]